MNDDVIKKALEAAKHAALRHEIEKRIKRGDTLWRNTPPALVDECVAECMTVHRQGHAWSEVVDQVPAAIAAFLDALPPGWHMDKPRDEIAAAIRRAGGAA